MLEFVRSLITYQNFLIYFAVLNVLAFLLCAYDKHMAQHKGSRVPEKDFMILSFLGGSTGVLLGMLSFHHKVRKAKFYIGVPMIFIAQALFYIITVY